MSDKEYAVGNYRVNFWLGGPPGQGKRTQSHFRKCKKHELRKLIDQCMAANKEKRIYGGIIPKWIYDYEIRNK